MGVNDCGSDPSVGLHRNDVDFPSAMHLEPFGGGSHASAPRPIWQCDLLTGQSDEAQRDSLGATRGERHILRPSI